jgi:hypothetical protein
MQSNKLRMAIRSTAAVAVIGLAAQAGAVSFSAGDVEASIYGYVQLNASYDLNENLGPAGYGSFSNLGGPDEDIEGNFAAYAEQSRVGFTATHAEGVNVKVEGDFLGGDFRLRHAYGEYNGFLMGQNWSNYNSWVGNTSLFDFNGPAALAGRQLRNTQVRYTSGPLSLSAEQPSNASIEGGTQKTSTPAFTARMEDGQGGLSYSVAVMAKQVSHDTGTNDDTAIGYGGFVALKMQVSDMISVQGAINYTDGASSYLYQSGAADGYMDGGPGGSLETISGIGGALGAGIGLGGGRSINIGVGMIEMDYDDAVAAGVSVGDESRRNLFLNYQWSPVKNVSMGVELSNWEAESVAGVSTDASRIMYVSRYSF